EGVLYNSNSDDRHTLSNNDEQISNHDDEQISNHDDEQTLNNNNSSNTDQEDQDQENRSSENECQVVTENKWTRNNTKLTRKGLKDLSNNTVNAKPISGFT
ncbi:16427_t:CDS:1, partial [Racocetra fulgida]